MVDAADEADEEDIGGKIEAEIATDQKTNGVVLATPSPLIDLPVRLTMVKKTIYK